jgi:hypothetical protein
MRILYPLALLGAAVFGAFACYSSLFFSWLTATPLTDDQRARAQYDAYAWFGISIACWLAIVALGVFWFLSHRKLALTAALRIKSIHKET